MMTSEEKVDEQEMLLAAAEVPKVAAMATGTGTGTGISGAGRGISWVAEGKRVQEEERKLVAEKRAEAWALSRLRVEVAETSQHQTAEVLEAEIPAMGLPSDCIVISLSVFPGKIQKLPPPSEQ